MKKSMEYHFGVPEGKKKNLYLVGFRYNVKSEGDDDEENGVKGITCLPTMPFAEYYDSCAGIEIVFEFPYLIDTATFSMDQVKLLQKNVGWYIQQSGKVSVSEYGEEDIFFLVEWDDEEQDVLLQIEFQQFLAQLGIEGLQFVDTVILIQSISQKKEW